MFDELQAVADVGMWWEALAVCFLLGTALTDFLENEVGDHLMRARAFAPGTVRAIALFTAAPGETGGGTEVTGGSYTRIDHAEGFANWDGTGAETTDVDSAGTGGLIQNNGIITFPTPSASWGLVSDMAMLDNTSGGNMWMYGGLVASKNVNNGDPAPTFQDGDLDITFA